MFYSLTVVFNSHISLPQVFCLLLLSLILKWCMLKIWMMLELFPRWRGWPWRILTRPFLMSLLQATSLFLGKRRWSRWVFMESSIFGALKAASQMTSAENRYESSQSHQPAVHHRVIETPWQYISHTNWNKTCNTNTQKQKSLLHFLIAEIK